MTKLKIIFISLITIIIIGTIIFGINLLTPKPNTTQNSSSSISSSAFNLQNQVQSIGDQFQSGLVEESLKSAPRLNLSSVSSSDLKQFSTKTFSDGSQLLKVDKSYYYNDKFFEQLKNPILSLDEGQPYTINKDFAYFILTKEFKLVFLDYGIKFIEEFKINNKDFLVVIDGDVFGGYGLNVLTLNTSTLRGFEDVPSGRFSEATKKDNSTLTLKLDNAIGRNPEIKSYDIDLNKFVAKFFAAQNSSSSAASTLFTFGN